MASVLVDQLSNGKSNIVIASSGEPSFGSITAQQPTTASLDSVYSHRILGHRRKARYYLNLETGLLRTE